MTIITISLYVLAGIGIGGAYFFMPEDENQYDRKRVIESVYLCIIWPILVLIGIVFFFALDNGYRKKVKAMHK